MFDLQEQDIFIVKACEWELGSVRHDLDYVPCDEWHVRNPSALRTRGTPVNVPRVLIIHMQNKFLLLISHDATAPGRGNLEAYVRLGTAPGNFLRSTWRMDFSVYFIEAFSDGLMHEFVILTERWIYLSLCLLLQWRWPLNVQCNSILSISSPRMGVTFCLCFATHEYMLTSTRVRIRVREHTCMQEYVYAHIYIN